MKIKQGEIEVHIHDILGGNESKDEVAEEQKENARFTSKNSKRKHEIAEQQKENANKLLAKKKLGKIPDIYLTEDFIENKRKKQ